MASKLKRTDDQQTGADRPIWILLVFVVEADNARYMCADHRTSRHTLRVPVIQTVCGHRLCQLCLTERKDDLQCPGGESDCSELSNELSYHIDYSISKEMMRAIVYCPQKPLGCEETMPYKNLEVHLTVCPHVEVYCNNKAYGCTVKLKRQKMQYHLKVCKLVPCSHCLDNILEDHSNEHTDICFQTMRPCQYHLLDCRETGTREQLHVHYDQHLTDHISSLLQRASSFAEETITLSADFSRTTGSVSAHSHRHIAKATRKMEEQNSKVDDAVMSSSQHIQTTTKYICDNLKKVEADINELPNRTPAVVEARQAVPSTSESTTSDIATVKTITALQGTQIKEFYERFQTLLYETVNGTTILKILNYRDVKRRSVMGELPCLRSPPFFTSRFGYKLSLVVYPDGDGPGKGTHLSAFMCVLKGDYDAVLQWPMNKTVHIMLMNQESHTRHLCETFKTDMASDSFQRPVSDRNTASGCPLFVAQPVAEKPPYLVDDVLFVKIIVE